MQLTGTCHRNKSEANSLLKSLVFILLGAVLVSGCGPKTAPVDQPANEVRLETLVAEAVETQRAEVAQREEIMTEAANQPSVLLAQTSTPTITPTLEFTLTPLPTLPLVDTSTPTPPGVPTRQPQDPALRLGEPDWVDTFDTANNWVPFSGQVSQIEIREGKFLYTIFQQGSGPTWTVSWPTVSNFYLEVTARTPQVCGGKDRFGLVFRAPEPDLGYRFEISCDGAYRMVTFSPTLVEELVVWTPGESILAGPNQINRIGVWAEGPVVAIYINGIAVAGLPHDAYRSGRFGLTITSEQTDNFTIEFDDLSFWTFE